MPVEKLITDVQKRVSEIIARGERGLLVSGVFLSQRESLCPEDLASYKTLAANSEFWQRSAIEPLRLELFLGPFYPSPRLRRGEYLKIYIFQNCAYNVTGNYSEDEEKLLVQDEFDYERRKFERLRNKFSLANHIEPKYERPNIPEEIRIAVWRRDSGRCAGCGSRERLEYDHIIPISQGGSNTARNIELLCENCNRSKGDRIQ